MPRDCGHMCRSYVIKDGSLFISLMADGGTYEFEPLGLAKQQLAKVSGTATYRERIALLPSAVFEVTLEDVSRADAPSDLIGRAVIEHPRNPPITFQVSYDPSKVPKKAIPIPCGRAS